MGASSPGAAPRHMEGSSARFKTRLCFVDELLDMLLIPESSERDVGPLQWRKLKINVVCASKHLPYVRPSIKNLSCVR